MTPHVIVPTTCRDLAMVGKCLEGVRHYCPDARLFIVANTETEREYKHAASLLQCFRSGVLIMQQLGYVNAVNLGFKFIRESAQDSDLVCVLNDDVIVAGDFLAPLCRAMEDGAAQAGPAIHHVGRSGFWGVGDEPYLFLEGWCWVAKVSTILAASSLLQPPTEVIYDSAYSPGYCEDCDLSIRIQQLGGTIQEVPTPILHLRSKTFGANREPFWTRNREYLVRRWRLNEPAAA